LPSASRGANFPADPTTGLATEVHDHLDEDAFNTMFPETVPLQPTNTDASESGDRGDGQVMWARDIETAIIAGGPHFVDDDGFLRVQRHEVAVPNLDGDIVMTDTGDNVIVSEVISLANRLSVAWNPGLDENGEGSTRAPSREAAPNYDPYSPHDRSREETTQELTQLLNFCQRHTRCGPTCLRQEGTEDEYCRFNFPFSLTRQTSVRVHPDDTICVTLARNDELMNCYGDNEGLIPLSWRANCDCKLIVSPYHLYKYLTKYVCKPEPATRTLDIVLRALDRHGQTTTVAATVRRLLARMVRNTDVSCQEASQHVLGLRPVMCSRHFFDVSLCSRRVEPRTARPSDADNDNDVEVNGQDGDDMGDMGPAGIQLSRSRWEEYCTRDLSLPGAGNASFMQFLRTLSGGDDVVMVYPRPRFPVRETATPEDHTLYKRYYVQLHVPFDNAAAFEALGEREILELHATLPYHLNGMHTLEARHAAVQRRRAQIRVQNAAQGGSESVDQMDFDCEPAPPLQRDTQHNADWMEAASRHLQSGQDGSSQRLVDHATNVCAADDNLAEENYLEGLPSFMIQQPPAWYVRDDIETLYDEIRTEGRSSEPPPHARCVQPSELNSEQRLVYDVVERHAAQMSTIETPSPLLEACDVAVPLRAIVTGTAGCGKSFVLDALRTLLGNRLRVCAFTGQAASLVGGCTIHR
jgi:hypothetical protein